MNNTPISVVGVILYLTLHRFNKLKAIWLSERLVQIHGVGISGCRISKEWMMSADVDIIFITCCQCGVHDFNQP
jgi:hypothetical protein